MIGMLETLRIAHGKAFESDERMKKVFTEAAAIGRTAAKALAWAPRVSEDMAYAYPGERRWKNIFFGAPTFSTSDYTDPF